MIEEKRFPLVGFEGERYFVHHYIVDFGDARISVTWKNKGWSVIVWGVWARPNIPHLQDELDVLTVLHHLKDTYGGNDDCSGNL